MTFSTIQTLTNGDSNIPVATNYVSPGDDASVARLIADRYEQQGIDPRNAYDNPDDAINDFHGLT